MQPEKHAGKVLIINVDDTNVAALENRGDPALIGASVGRFIAWRRQNDLPPQRSATFNIFHSDLGEGAPENYRIDICAATDQPVADNASGVVAKTIPAGRCAVLRLIGSDDALGEAIHYLRAEWLPGSGEQRREFPMYLQRVKFFP